MSLSPPMYRLFSVAALTALFLLSPLPSLAAESHDHGEAAKSSAPAPAGIEGLGVVVESMPAANKVKITHDPIPALKWPGMTMDFQVEKGVALDALKTGAKVRFWLKQSPNGYIIQKIGPQ